VSAAVGILILLAVLRMQRTGVCSGNFKGRDLSCTQREMDSYLTK
jgi:hypothetical protein